MCRRKISPSQRGSPDRQEQKLQIAHYVIKNCNVMCNVINYLYTNKHSPSATKILHIHIYNLNNTLRKKKLTGIILILLVFQGVVFSVIIFYQPIDVLSISF